MLTEDTGGLRAPHARPGPPQNTEVYQTAQAAPTGLALREPLVDVLAFPAVKLLLDYRPALSRRTGVGEYAHELAAALARTAEAGEQLRLFTSSWSDRPDPAGIPEGATVIDRRVPVRVLNRLWHRHQWPPVEWLAGSADVAISTHPLLMPARRARQVVTVHDLYFLRHPEHTSGEVRRDYGALVREHSRQAALVVVNSRDTASAVESELGVPADRIVLCRPGLPGWIGTPAPNPPPAGGYVLFVGTLEPRKNVGTLLAAWTLLVQRGLPLPKLRLVGAAGPDAGTWLARLQVPPLSGTVEYSGYVPDADRRAIYQGARLLVLPSWHEGFGLPALEAMALGVPVVASSRGALPEVVGDAGVLVSPDDARGLAAAIAGLLADPERCARLRTAGMARAATFTWDAAARSLRDACRKVIADHR
jgi:glycosyltransferase involved in cell wall biosynthesis